MRLDYECGLFSLVVLGIQKAHGLLTAIRVLFSYLVCGETPRPHVSSSTNEEALLTVQKSQLLMLIRYTHSATVDFSVFVCVCLSVDNSANNSLTSKYCVVALFSLTHKKHQSCLNSPILRFKARQSNFRGLFLCFPVVLRNKLYASF